MTLLLGGGFGHSRAQDRDSVSELMSRTVSHSFGVVIPVFASSVLVIAGQAQGTSFRSALPGPFLLGTF